MLQKMVACASILALLTSGLPGQTAATGGAIPNSAPQSTQQSTQQNPQPSAPQAAPLNPPGQPEYKAPKGEYTQAYGVLGVWKPYRPHGLPLPVLHNSDRLASLLRDGKLMLSLNDAVALTLENNFDIAIARYNLDIADTDLMLAKSGGTVRGVSTGLLTGTPGGNASSTSTAGATGSGSGGTSTGSGGAGAGASGVVFSVQNAVGSPIDSYDPILTGKLSTDHARLWTRTRRRSWSALTSRTPTFTTSTMPRDGRRERWRR